MTASRSPAAGGLPREWLTSEYDSLGMLEGTFGILQGTTGSDYYVSATDYSPYGETLRMSLADDESTANVNVSYQYYEPNRRLKQLTAKRETSTGYQPVTDLNYTYDQVGNVTQITDAPGGTPSDTQCFTYDYLRRLTQAWTPASHNCATTPSVAAMGGAAPYWQNWTFDVTGNRRTETSHAAGGDTARTYTYPAPGTPRPHAVQAVTTDTPTVDHLDEFDYDATGNTTSRNLTGETSTLDYDVEGRLTEVAESDADTSRYLYDADGSRLIKREPEATTLYLPGMELRRDASSGAVTATRYYTHNGATVASRTPAGLSWMLPDHNGTVTTTVNFPATSATKRYQDPYGNSRGPQPTSWPNTRGFLNAPTDTTGLTHLGARQYDPVAGRFLTVDPIIDPADPQQLNAYSYSVNNPITFTDPDGLRPICGGGMAGDCGYEGSLWGTNPEKAQQYSEQRRNPGRSQAESEEAYLNGATLGQPLSESALDTLRKRYGYQGSRNFTRLEALRFAAQSAEAAAAVCHALADGVGGGPGGCSADALDDFFDVVAAVAEFAYQLTPVSDAVDCVSGDGCIGLAVGLVPGAKAVKAVDNVVDAIRAGRKGCTGNSFVPGTEVLMADGTRKPIEDVEIGDEVLVL